MQTKPSSRKYFPKPVQEHMLAANLAFEITYVDATSRDTSHFADQPARIQRASGSTGNRVLKAIKGGLRKHQVIVRGPNLNQASVAYFKANPAHKLISIVEVITVVDPAALALLLSPVKIKAPKQHKTFDPRSVAGCQAYLEQSKQTSGTTVQRAA